MINVCLETSLKINEILVAYPDNYLEDLNKVLIARPSRINPNYIDSLDLRLEADSYTILKYEDIDSELRNFVDKRIKGESKKFGGTGGTLCVSRNLEESISVFDRYDYSNIIKLTLIRTKNSRDIKRVKFNLWGDGLRFLRSELSKTKECIGGIK